MTRIWKKVRTFATDKWMTQRKLTFHVKHQAVIENLDKDTPRRLGENTIKSNINLRPPAQDGKQDIMKHYQFELTWTYVDGSNIKMGIDFFGKCENCIASAILVAEGTLHESSAIHMEVRDGEGRFITSYSK